VPSSSEASIQELCARIRVLCVGPYSEETEEELRKLAGELRIAIKQHLDMAKSSLSIKKTAIDERDSEK
jgi:hypothetical protein